MKKLLLFSYVSVVVALILIIFACTIPVANNNTKKHNKHSNKERSDSLTNLSSAPYLSAATRMKGLVDMGDYYLWAGDIMLFKNDPNHQRVINLVLNPLHNQNDTTRTVKDWFVSTWPNGIVKYYYNTDNFTSDEKAKIKRAMDTYKALCDIEFIESSNIIESRVSINKRDMDMDLGGRSSLGVGILNFIDLNSSGFTYGTVLHEMGHTLGLGHEHQRNDRDDYITINWFNIFIDSFLDFDKLELATNYGPYDYNSIMHYGPYAASNNENKTIDSHGHKIGQISGLSILDIAGIRKLYNKSRNLKYVLRIGLENNDGDTVYISELSNSDQISTGQWNSINNSNQKWVLKYYDNGAFSLINCQTGHYLTYCETTKTYIGYPETTDSNYTQKWELVEKWEKREQVSINGWTIKKPGTNNYIRLYNGRLILSLGYSYFHMEGTPEWTHFNAFTSGFVSTIPYFKKYESLGGSGGSVFDCQLQKKDSEQYKRLYHINFKYGSWMDSIKFYWKNEKGEISESARCGGSGGNNSKDIYFEDDEYIIKVKVQYGWYVNSITLYTNKRTVTCGASGGDHARDYDFGDYECHGFFGKATDYLDSIGFYVYSKDNVNR